MLSLRDAPQPAIPLGDILDVLIGGSYRPAPAARLLSLTDIMTLVFGRGRGVAPRSQVLFTAKGVQIRTRDELRFYQGVAAEEIKQKLAVLLAIDMSLGKTVSVLTAVVDLLVAGMISKVLVVAPLMVAKHTWPDEIEGWEHLRHLRYSVMVGTEQQRLDALSDDADVYIINRENVPWLWAVWKNEWPYDMVVWDESSGLKAGKKRTATRKLTRFGAICAARKHINRVVELSGTPSPNGLQDLWGQAYVLDSGERLGATQKAFRDRWFDSDYLGFKYEPKPHAHKEIMSRLSDVMISMKAEDYLELPPVLPIIKSVQLPPKIMAEYKLFERTLVSDAYDVEAVSKGVLTNKMLQFANGSMYQEGGVDPKTLRRVRGPDVHIHDEKLKALEEIIEDANGASILVAYSFRFDLERIRKRFPKAVVFDETPDFVDKWNAGKIQIGLSHPASIGHGLNLQYGGHIAVWYGLTWSLELYQQFNKRLPRPGQKHHTVFIHHIVAKGTADESALLAMSTKGATQDSVMNAVRARITQNA